MKHNIKKILKSVRQFKLDAFLAPLFVALEVVFECFLPLVMAKLIDEMYVVQTSGFRNLIIYGVVMITMALASFACGTLSGIYAARGSAGFAKNLREDIFNKVQMFSFANIDKFSTSSLVTRLTTDITNIQMAYMMIIRNAVRAPFMLIFSMIMVFSINWKIGLVLLVIVPLLGAFLIGGVLYVFPIFDRVFKKYDALNESVQENVKGMRVVKSYVREDYEKKKFAKASNDVRWDFVKAEKIIALSMPAMQFAVFSAMTIITILGSVIIVKTLNVPGSVFENGVYTFAWGELSTGQLSSLFQYTMQMLMNMMMLAMIMVMITMSSACINRCAEVLDEESTLKNPENPIMDVKDGSIEFKNVSFKYSEKAEKNALTNINLSIKSGETIGIIGGTGSAKSSLVNLISRLYDVTEGEVIVGGENVKKYDMEVLRNQVSVVLQKNILFSGTIKSNLLWGNKDATDEEIQKAAKLAQADSFIETYPDKYDHVVEQGGANFSGGQKQRLCIARALLKKPKILILDDSTSAVDTKTDALIRKALKEEIPDTTKIIIAQRIASIQDADKIVVMNNGEIVDCGTHEELIKRNEIYQDVYYSQNKITKGGNSND